MTTRVRSIFIGVAGVMLTVVALLWVQAAPVSYVGSADIVLVRSRQEYVPNPLTAGIGNLIDVAALVERAINRAPDTRTVVGDDLTLADQGVRRGTVIQLANSGSQWANDFNRPMLSIDVVAPSAAEAKSRLAAAIARVDRTLASLQQDQLVARDQRVVARLAPASNRVLAVGGSSMRSWLAALLLGSCLTTACARRLARTPLAHNAVDAA